MDQQTRYEVERAKWDAHAHHAHGSRELGPEDVLPLDMTFERYAKDQLLLSGMAEFLGDLTGRRILEYGCGLGQLTVVLARSGALVTTFDLSEASIEVARKRAELNGLADRIEFHVASGEALPFEAGSFDLAIGKAILHHLDPVIGARELARVLAPGGRATFSEPLGTNPLVVFARAHLPYPGKHERGADRPLTVKDLAAWRAPFAQFKLRPVQLLSMIERAKGFGYKIPILRRIDRVILRTVPAAWRLCRYGVLYLQKSDSVSEAASQKP
ncbi:MAG: class I SAM-dependent methyltransferase [Chloroflexota bacterium]|nr:class I SAM-dependent methyltransferase [Chloroflexota bacterium]